MCFTMKDYDFFQVKIEAKEFTVLKVNQSQWQKITEAHKNVDKEKKALNKLMKWTMLYAVKQRKN